MVFAFELTQFIILAVGLLIGFMAGRVSLVLGISFRKNNDG